MTDHNQDIARSLSLSVSRRVSLQGPLPPFAVVQLVHGLAAALEPLHAAGRGHGALSPDTVGYAADGSVSIGPPALDAGRQDDARRVAEIAALALTGEVPRVAALGWVAPDGCPPRVVDTLRPWLTQGAETPEADLAQRVTALDAAVRQTASDRITGVWEALGRQDYRMAEVICEAALACVPDHPEALQLIHHARTQRATSDQTKKARTVGDAAPLSPDASAPPLEEAGLRSDSWAQELLGPNTLGPTANARVLNPWIVFGMGMVLLVLVLVVVTLATLILA